MTVQAPIQATILCPVCRFAMMVVFEQGSVRLYSCKQEDCSLHNEVFKEPTVTLETVN